MKNRNLLIGMLILSFGAGLFVINASSAYGQSKARASNAGDEDGITVSWDYFNQIRNNQKTGGVNAADELNARNQASRLKSAGAIGLNWQSMGPDNYAGRTRAIILDNQSSSRSTLFAGGVSGGVWKSTTRGLTWNSIETGNTLLNVSCMTQSPDGAIYVGTGESFASERFNLFGGFIGHGIYKSTDGNSLALIASTDPGSFNDPNAEWAFVNKIAAGSNNKVFAATNAGLKYSADGGSSWVLAKAGSENLSGISTDVKFASDGAVAASVNNNLYISANGDPNAFELRSTGAGADSLPNTGLSRIEVAFAPSDANTVYAVLIADGSVSGYLLGQLQGIYVSKDKGITWRLVGPGASTLFNVFGNGANTIHRGNYSACISVDNTNADKLFVGGVNVWEGTKIQPDGFYQWQQMTNGEAGTYFHSIIQDPVNAGVFYFASDKGISTATDNFATFKTLNKNYLTSMFYTVGYDDKGRAIGGSQGDGVVFLDREGNTVETGNKILPSFVGGFVEMSMINPTAVFYSSTGGFLTRSADLGVSEANDFVPSAIANTNSNVFLTPFRMWESFNNENSRDSITFVAKKDYAAGEVVMVKSRNAYNSSQRFPFEFTLPVNLANGDSIRAKDIISSKFFLGVTNAIYMTKEVLDFGKEPKWFKIATITGIPTCMAYSSDANYLFVGTSDGKLVRIANIALAYDSIRADVSSSGCIISNSIVKDFGSRYVTSVSVDPKNDNHVLVTLGNYGNTDFIFRSTDALAQMPTFSSAQGNLPAMPIYSSLIEFNNPSRVLVGTDLGVFTTESIGASSNWTAENTGMGAVPVMMIRQQTTSRPWIENIPGVNNLGAIYIATHGKGIFENRLYVGIDGPDSPSSTAKGNLIIYPNPVKSVVNFQFTGDGHKAMEAYVYNLGGEMVSSVNFGIPSTGKHTYSVPVTQLNQGSYLLRVTSGNQVMTAKFVVVR